MAYLTDTILNNLFGSAQVDALVPTADEKSAAIEAATAVTESALKAAGYDDAVPATNYLADASDCPWAIRMVAYEEWLRHAYGRNNKSVPQDLRQEKWRVDQVRAGEYEIPGVNVNTSRAVGGVTTVETSEDVSEEDGSLAPVMTRENLTGY